MRTLALLHTVSLLAVVQAASIQVKGNDTSIKYVPSSGDFMASFVISDDSVLTPSTCHSYVGSGWKTRVGCEYLYTMYSFKEGDYLQWDFTGLSSYRRGISFP